MIKISEGKTRCKQCNGYTERVFPDGTVECFDCGGTKKGRIVAGAIFRSDDCEPVDPAIFVPSGLGRKRKIR